MRSSRHDDLTEVLVDHGTVAWPNGLDLDPPVLHGDFEPANSRTERQAG